ncbi:MAG: putative sulfate exporter family transporter [Wenzhouxiangella sp.]
MLRALPGLIVCAAIAALAWVFVGLLRQLPEPIATLPASPMVIAILAGLALAGVAARRASWKPGLDLARGILLKTAVALIGLRLSLLELGLLGGRALPLVVIVVLTGLSLTYWLVRSAGGNRHLAGLLCAGTAICGASAIAALAPALKARPQETAYAVACVALVGLLATLLYPFILPPLLADPIAVGLVMGAAIHDTAQVTAAAAAYEQLWQADGTLNAATVTKLIRNFSMVLVIPLLAWLLSEPGARPRYVPIPLFIVAFLALSVMRSAGDAALGPEQSVWQALILGAGQISQFLFAMAMAAIAMGIRFEQMKALGPKPAAAALLAALILLGLAVGWVRFLL